MNKMRLLPVDPIAYGSDSNARGYNQEVETIDFTGEIEEDNIELADDRKKTPPPPPPATTTTLQENEECVICFEAKKTVVCIPCKHCCLCSNCGNIDTIKECPLCRQVVVHLWDMADVYFS